MSQSDFPGDGKVQWQCAEDFQKLRSESEPFSVASERELYKSHSKPALAEWTNWCRKELELILSEVANIILDDEFYDLGPAIAQNKASQKQKAAHRKAEQTVQRLLALTKVIMAPPWEPFFAQSPRVGLQHADNISNKAVREHWSSAIQSLSHLLPDSLSMPGGVNYSAQEFSEALVALNNGQDSDILKRDKLQGRPKFVLKKSRMELYALIWVEHLRDNYQNKYEAQSVVGDAFKVKPGTVGSWLSQCRKYLDPVSVKQALSNSEIKKNVENYASDFGIFVRSEVAPDLKYCGNFYKFFCENPDTAELFYEKADISWFDN